MDGWGKGILGNSAFDKNCFIACPPMALSKDLAPPTASQNSSSVYPSHILSQAVCLRVGTWDLTPRPPTSDPATKHICGLR